jgi:hypothetical protein
VVCNWSCGPSTRTDWRRAFVAAIRVGEVADCVEAVSFIRKRQNDPRGQGHRRALRSVVGSLSAEGVGESFVGSLRWMVPET